MEVLYYMYNIIVLSLSSREGEKGDILSVGIGTQQSMGESGSLPSSGGGEAGLYFGLPATYSGLAGTYIGLYGTSLGLRVSSSFCDVGAKGLSSLIGVVFRVSKGSECCSSRMWLWELYGSEATKSSSSFSRTVSSSSVVSLRG